MVRLAKKLLLQIQFAALAALLSAAPALAAPAGMDLVRWIAAHTNLPVAQIAVVKPGLVYSLEPLGPSLPTGEVIALVRAESTTSSWVAERGYESWDAHLLFDCANARAHVIRSATYAEHNREGRAFSETPGSGWTSPDPSQPLGQLMRAACDPTFRWPLRSLSSFPAQPLEREAKVQPVDLEIAAEPEPAPAPQPSSATSDFGIQVAQSPWLAGAKRALAAAIRALGPDAESLKATTEQVDHGDKQLYVARLDGFATAEMAQDSCRALANVGQDCFVRTSAALAVVPPPPESPNARLLRPQLARIADGRVPARAPAQPAAHALGGLGDAAATVRVASNPGATTGLDRATPVADAHSRLLSVGWRCVAVHSGRSVRASARREVPDPTTGRAMLADVVGDGRSRRITYRDATGVGSS
jgi:hypothetical protein